MDAGRAGFDKGLDDFVHVERAAEAGFGVGENRQEVVDVTLAFHRLNLIRTLERDVDPLYERRRRIRRVEALVRIGLRGQVRVGGDLPAGEVDRVQTGFGSLNRLSAGQCAQGGNVRLVRKRLPEPICSQASERVVDVHGAAKTNDVVAGIRALDPRPARI